MHIAAQYEFTPALPVHPPVGEYNGLTLMWARPSRFDLDYGYLGAANGGRWLEQVLTENGITLNECERRLSGDATPIRAGTKAIIEFDDSTAGAPFLVPGRFLHVRTFEPQSIVDPPGLFKDTESSEDDDGEGGKDRQPTRPANWWHWSRWAIWKTLNPSKFSLPPKQLEWTINRATTLRQLAAPGRIYIDIETDYAQNLLCVGFCREDGPVCIIPVRGEWERRNFPWRELTRALLNADEIIGHNLSYDLTVLLFWYRIGFTKRIWDTMSAQHRFAPEAEKSLHHTIAAWTWYPDHKGQFVIPRNSDQWQQLMNYNAWDVQCLRDIRAQQVRFAPAFGVVESIKAANAMVRPYILATCTGIRIKEETLVKSRQILVREINQALRLMKLLCGQELTSSKKCVDYFHGKLGWDPVARTKRGAPKLGAKELYKLAVKTKHPLIQVILIYREHVKALGNLYFSDAHARRVSPGSTGLPSICAAEAERPPGDLAPGLL